MYLKTAYLEHNGPLKSLNLSLPFKDDGRPKTVVLVGGNGSGKTSFLSSVADALIEAAAAGFDDVSPMTNGGARTWFRVVGASTITFGAEGSCTLLEFAHDGQEYYFIEKGGRLPVADVVSRVPEVFRPHLTWNTDDSFKNLHITKETARQIFASGAYAYFPANRYEAPHWLNKNNILPPDFDLEARFSNELRKPIYVESGLEKFSQWALAMLIDTRMDVRKLQNGASSMYVGVGSGDVCDTHTLAWASLNTILKIILDDESAHFIWLGRGTAGIGFHSAQGVSLPLNALSSGQATLLNIFGSLMRYGDRTTGTIAAQPHMIKGTCVIDEIDAHLHIDLQYRALPRLLTLFPNVQFVLSSHSPLFALGMNNELGPDGFLVLDMPSGTPISPEAYSEFRRALDVMKETSAFNRELKNLANAPGKLLVLVEGETDPIYLQAAAKLLNMGDVLESVEIDWIGAKDKVTGQGFHTGKDALNMSFNFLKANAGALQRPIVLLYDSDVNKPDFDEQRLFVRSLPRNSENKKVRDGIENLLPEAVITDEEFDTKTAVKGNGTEVTTKTLNKMRLCDRLCKGSVTEDIFSKFAPVLETIREISKRVQQ